MHKRLSLSDFRTAKAESLSDCGEVLIDKVSSLGRAKTIGVEADRTIEFVISTSAIDRDGDTIAVDGWELSNFKAGGAVLFGHDASDLPIAKPTATFVEGGKLIGRAQFASAEDGNGYADQVYRMIKGGFLRATSVGFLPWTWSFSEDRQGGIDFLTQELLEWSVVPVPANPEALLQASKKGLDITPVRQWMERALDGDTVCYVPRHEIEISRNVLSGKTSAQVPVQIPFTLDTEAGTTINWSTKSEDTMTAKTVITWDAAHADGTPKAPRDESWDGPAEVADAGVDDLLVMAAWREDKSRDDLIKGDFKLPHHAADGQHNVVFRGVAAAMGALLGARGGVDIPDNERRGVYDHLAKHYREFDEEPPELKAYSAEELKSLFPDNEEVPVMAPCDFIKSIDAAFAGLALEDELSADDLKDLVKAKQTLDKLIEAYTPESEEDYLEIDDIDEFRRLIEQSIETKLVLPLTGRML
jgi:HK97 family phage prohead protease